jgi:hypothetical protein
VILISKAPWYKEAAGFVAVMGWLLFLGLMAYGIVTESRLPGQWWYMLSLATTNTVASIFRWASGRISVESEEI